MWFRRPALLVLVSVIIACGVSGRATTIIEVELDDGLGTVKVRRPIGCPAEPGTPTDMASEPAQWHVYGDYLRWYTIDECPVRVDVISHIPGAAHCGWEDVRYLSIGDPLGASIDGETIGSPNRLRYLWNSGGVIDGMAGARSILRGEISTSTEDTGYRQGDTELWIDPLDQTHIYLARGDEADVYELITIEGGALCA